MVNSLVHEAVVVDRLTAEDGDALASALRYFGTDLPLEKTLCVELLQETLSDGSEVSTLRIREAEDIR